MPVARLVKCGLTPRCSGLAALAAERDIVRHQSAHMSPEGPVWSDRLPKSLDRQAHRICLFLLSGATAYLLLRFAGAKDPESALAACAIVGAAWYAFFLLKFRLSRDRRKEQDGDANAGA